jgi:hypothetical protein
MQQKIITTNNNTFGLLAGCSQGYVGIASDKPFAAKASIDSTFKLCYDSKSKSSVLLLSRRSCHFVASRNQKYVLKINVILIELFQEFKSIILNENSGTV